MSSIKSQFGKFDRFFVPDLTPMDRRELKALRPEWVFIAESPHISEVEPERQDERRPLCGAAGRQWWAMLSQVLEGQSNPDVSLARMLKLCTQYRIGVMNAVQYPLDPKITLKYPDAEPVRNLGFAKVTGEFGFKKLKTEKPVLAAVRKLRERLESPELKQTWIWVLGNDAEWFVTQALGADGAQRRVHGKIPHPSAWWRQGGLFGRIAEEKLRELFRARAA